MIILFKFSLFSDVFLKNYFLNIKELIAKITQNYEETTYIIIITMDKITNNFVVIEWRKTFTNKY